jgi:RimJ/RimL family protein N-acetyltransferase
MGDRVWTERLLLRDLEPDDLDALLEVLGDPIAMRYYPVPFDRDGVAAWIEWARRSYRENGFGLWAVIRRSDGRFLGDCGPMLQPVEDWVIPEVGYHIVPAEQGRGYATEAARACVAWIFANTSFDFVCSLVSPENGPSRAVAAKVHAAMREFTWAKNSKQMCLYSTERQGSAVRRHVSKSCGRDQVCMRSRRPCGRHRAPVAAASRPPLECGADHLVLVRPTGGLADVVTSIAEVLAGFVAGVPDVVLEIRAADVSRGLLGSGLQVTSSMLHVVQHPSPSNRSDRTCGNWTANVSP